MSQPKYSAHAQFLRLEYGLWLDPEHKDRIVIGWGEEGEFRVLDSLLIPYLNELGKVGWQIALGGGMDLDSGCGPTTILLQRIVPAEQLDSPFLSEEVEGGPMLFCQEVDEGHLIRAAFQAPNPGAVP